MLRKSSLGLAITLAFVAISNSSLASVSSNSLGQQRSIQQINPSAAHKVHPLCDPIPWWPYCG